MATVDKDEIVVASSSTMALQSASSQNNDNLEKAPKSLIEIQEEDMAANYIKDKAEKFRNKILNWRRRIKKTECPKGSLFLKKRKKRGILPVSSQVRLTKVLFSHSA